VVTDLWTPTGVVPLGVAPVGHNAETGSTIVAHTIVLKSKDLFGKEHKLRVQVLADKDTSKAQIEEMIGNAADRFVQEVREKYTKRPATVEEQKTIARALKELRTYTKRRVASTSKRINF
jgi:hypothetical protein